MVTAAAPQSQPSAEEEALKRNTDCVYFLASPLTCKKGSECEYRHSDIARLNPRDCYFWLNGNCLNPKCAFRHPPLDGLLGTQIPTSAGTAQPILQTATTPSPQVLSATSKPGVPCKFFQSGFCLKGDWCPFLHAPNSAKNKASLVPVTASAFGPSNSKKDVQEKKVPPTNTSKPIKESSDPQAAGKTEPALLRNELSINNEISGTSSINKLSDYNNGGLVSWSNRIHQSHPLDEPGHIDNKDVGDVSREPSPGFDVLVDDEMRDPNIYHGEDRYGMSREYEARNEFDIDHFTDYNMIADDNNDEHHDYESNRYRKGQYSSDPSRASSERSYLKRRPYARDDNRGQVDGLDLRHRLARNKQPNGLRSVISHEHARDKHVEDRNLRETSRSSRLRGRIRLPQRSSSPVDRGTEHGRLSPERPRPSSNQGRILDRMKGRVEEVSSDGWKNHRGLHARRDVIGDYNADFNGPRSLAELKHRKNVEPSGQRVMMDREQLGKRKYSGVDGHQQNGNDLSFEGPKPLQEILKRKRRDISGSISNNISSTNGDITEESNNQKEGKDEGNNVSIERTEAEERETALEPVDSKVEGEIIKSGVEEKSEVYEEREEFDSEQDGGEDYELYEGDDNGEGEGEYLEDEDDDDEEFAKKMGVVY